MAKTKTTAAPARRLTLREVRLIQLEALMALRDKAAKAISASATKVHDHNTATIRAAILAATTHGDFVVLLQDAMMASAKEEGDSVSFSSYGANALDEFLSASVQKYIKRNSLKRHEPVNRIASILNPDSRSSYAPEHLHCLASEEAKYKPLVDEINKLELTFALGADAASVLADLKARIAKL